LQGNLIPFTIFGMMANDLTLLLNRMTRQPVTAEELLPLVYGELRRVAAQKMAGEVPGQTLQATALVHEAWLKLGGGEQSWENRAHFFGAAAEAMRRILVDRARSRTAKRHGGGLQRVPLEGVEIEAPAPDEELLELHEALGQLAEVHPEKAELVKLRYFAGLTVEEASGVLGLSAPTVKRHWAFARAWLFREIQRRRTASGGPVPQGETANPTRQQA
jgi:RNA polymerase sigma factor (TIGR02999 family)